VTSRLTSAQTSECTKRSRGSSLRPCETEMPHCREAGAADGKENGGVRVTAEVGVRWASGWALCEPIPFECSVVHLEGYGPNRAFKIVPRDRDTEHGATDDLALGESTWLDRDEADLGDRERPSGWVSPSGCTTFPGPRRTWAIESDHRGLKQCGGLERCQSRAGRRSAITSGWESGCSCGWSVISTPPGSVGTRPGRKGFGERSEPPSPNHYMAFHDCVNNILKCLYLARKLCGWCNPTEHRSM
jgi:hypothetical protein